MRKGKEGKEGRGREGKGGEGRERKGLTNPVSHQTPDLYNIQNMCPFPNNTSRTFVIVTLKAPNTAAVVAKVNAVSQKRLGGRGKGE